jgi:hypothetical protein
MGVDYKAQRSKQARDAHDLNGLVLAGLPLAEWIVVVEGLDPADKTKSLWEIVYDATSGAPAPRRQIVRFLAAVIASQPSEHTRLGMTRLSSDRLPVIEAPIDISKYLGN